MNIAIDYDHTYTRDPTLWVNLAKEANKAGHLVIMVTGRRPDDPVTVCPIFSTVLYTSGELKREYVERYGFKIDVWVDDEPGTIEPCRILQFDGD